MKDDEGVAGKQQKSSKRAGELNGWGSKMKEEGVAGKQQKN